MKTNLLGKGIAVIIACSGFFSSSAQENAAACKVLIPALSINYKGSCNDGFANGQGEAIGSERYVGNFKDGLPNGKGTYYFSDSIYHSGNFQDGLKEGKGETHYAHKNKAESIIKGYWSGDIYRGKSYKTYEFDAAATFDLAEVNASSQSGNTITFITSTTTGSPNGSTSDFRNNKGNVLSLVQLVSIKENVYIRQISKFESGISSTVTYELSKFPVSLIGTLSNGKNFNLDLYKAAKWTVRLYLNN
jgi:hypothetical protein